jgi:hypothetical protein
MIPTKPHPDVRRQNGAADDALHRQAREFVGQRLVTDRDVAAEQQRQDHRDPVAPAARARGIGDESERKRQSEADGEKLLGIEGNVENLPGDVQHPEHDGGNQQRLKDIGPEDGGSRGGGGELRRARNEAFFRRG